MFKYNKSIKDSKISESYKGIKDNKISDSNKGINDNI